MIILFVIYEHYSEQTMKSLYAILIISQILFELAHKTSASDHGLEDNYEEQGEILLDISKLDGQYNQNAISNINQPAFDYQDNPGTANNPVKHRYSPQFDYSLEHVVDGFVRNNVGDKFGIHSTKKSEDQSLGIKKCCSGIHGYSSKKQERHVSTHHRKKRGFRSRAKSSSSKSRSRGSSSNSGSSQKSSSRGSSWSWGGRKSSSSNTGINKNKGSTSTNSRTTSANTGSSSTPNIGWNKPSSSSGTKPSAPNLENINIPAKPYPVGVYPSIPSSGIPNNPSPGYPNPHIPSPGYPNPKTHTIGYPDPHRPNPGYPYPKSPSAGYPYPNIPSSGYPNPKNPSSSYPSPFQPAPSYPNPKSHSPGYPDPNKPSPGYPDHKNPSLGYPDPYKPSPGYPVQNPNLHTTGTFYPGVGHSNSNFYAPHKPKSKKEKITEKISQAIKGYAMYKMNKKMMKKNRASFISPSFMGAGSYGHFNNGGFNMHGGKGKNGKMKLAKKIIGTAIKLQIAKYALKFGAKAAKAYFEYKLGRNLKEEMIEKFLGRYHRHRTRNIYRQRKRLSASQNDFAMENITLGEDCKRVCKRGETLTCFFSLRVHLYQTISRACYDCPRTRSDCSRPECIVGSGRRKLVTVVNKKLPGPTIQVCEGDTILAEVQNDLPSAGVTLHFRGQSYEGTPYMEGTPGLTQFPISPGNIFAYSFRANKAGTHFWHANTGVLRSEGVYGPFIVKEIIDVHNGLYDNDLAEETITVSEEMEMSSEEQLVRLNQKEGNIQVRSLLINGIGFPIGQDGDMHSNDKIYSRITVQSGKRHRLRLISAVSTNCPFTFRILGQPVTVIYIDGSPLNSKEANVVLVSPGERFDLVLGSLPVGLHWIEIKGSLDCEKQLQYAVLESKEISSETIPTLKEEISHEMKLPTSDPRSFDSLYNKYTETAAFCNNTDIICSRNLTAKTPLPEQVKTPNITLYLALTKRKIHNERTFSLLHYDIKSMPVEEQTPTWQINNLTLRRPPEPLLTNQHSLNNDVCSLAGVRRQQCVDDYCECLHLLHLPVGKVVDAVFINEGEGNSGEPQTMYIHGYNFWIISQNKEFVYSNETFDNITSPYLDRLRVIVRDAEGLLIKNIENPVTMNSVTIPEGGYSVVRFITNNPGYWLIESSSVFRSASGMGMVLKVGEDENLPNIPKKYSKCG